MDDLDLAVMICLEAEAEESEEEKEVPRIKSDLFKCRDTEGVYEILIKRHLMKNENKFKEFFRLTPHLFHKVLGFIKEDISVPACNRYNKPIEPEQKLCLFSR